MSFLPASQSNFVLNKDTNLA